MANEAQTPLRRSWWVIATASEQIINQTFCKGAITGVAKQRVEIKGSQQMVEDFGHWRPLFSPIMCAVQHSLNLLQPRLHGSHACRVPGASSGRTCDDHFEESRTSLASKSCADPLRPCSQIPS